MSENLVFAEAYDHSLEKLSAELQKRNIDVTPKTITAIVGNAMEIVEASKLKGEEQNGLVTKIVRKIVVDAPIADEQEKLILDIIDQGIVSNVINLIISATRGELNINAAKSCATGCCIALTSRLSRK